MKKSAAEAHRMLSNTYGEAAISERTCRECFQRFKNGDFDVEDQHGIWWDQLGVSALDKLQVKWYWDRTHDMPAMVGYRNHWATAAPHAPKLLFFCGTRLELTPMSLNGKIKEDEWP
ncbi:hypothetical protein TNCV_3168811 [Trichonephila clavipes]|nr:hypothetical protein TNCV_3168811 [Trichonephila clavipes]